MAETTWTHVITKDFPDNVMVYKRGFCSGKRGQRENAGERESWLFLGAGEEGHELAGTWRLLCPR